MPGPFRQFNDFWESLPEESKLRMNKGDVEFGWLASSLAIKPAILQGRRKALKELIHEFDSHDFWKERDMATEFYKTDISYIGEYDEKSA